MYCTITSKLIFVELSSDGKAKIQLQIVMHDGASTTFLKRKVNKELEEKNRMLRENPGLLQLYKDLVKLERLLSLYLLVFKYHFKQQ